MLYHSLIVDLRTGISLMVILLVSFPLQCGNDTFPHEAIRGRAFSSARGDAFPPSRVAEGHELMGKCITKC